MEAKHHEAVEKSHCCGETRVSLWAWRPGPPFRARGPHAGTRLLHLPQRGNVVDLSAYASPERGGGPAKPVERSCRGAAAVRKGRTEQRRREAEPLSQPPSASASSPFRGANRCGGTRVSLKTICNDLQFVGTWIYLYNVGIHHKTGITAYKRRSLHMVITYQLMTLRLWRTLLTVFQTEAPASV